jgi:protein SCO1
MDTAVDSSEREFAGHVQRLLELENRTELSGLLHETNPVYHHKSAASIVRMRGWVLLALGRVGVTDGELVYVLEELESGLEPYLIAAAARALCSYSTPRSSFIPVVQQALTTIRYRDDVIVLDQYGSYARSGIGTTAARELRRTLGWLKSGAVHACCGGEAHSIVKRDQADPESPPTVTFEDQDGVQVGFREFFTGRPSIIAFFYTRCNNAQKCSLTMTKLGRLQMLLAKRDLAQQVRVAAITYDPAFDLPARLRTYALDRGVQLDTNNRVLRTTENWQGLSSYFNLGVSFAGSIVTRHRIELFVLDPQTRIAASFERLQWSEEDVVRELEMTAS